MVFINIAGFINDLSAAFNLYKDLLINDKKVRAAAIEHYKEHAIIVHQEVQMKVIREVEITLSGKKTD